MNRTLIGLGLSAFAATAAYALLSANNPTETLSSSQAQGVALAAIQIPEITGNAAIGQRIFETSCVACHGANATGVDGAGPPLIHVIYEPSHHADEAFQRAVASGVRSHHWSFGDMPPVSGLTRGDVAMVISYIRTLQRANGIN